MSNTYRKLKYPENKPESNGYYTIFNSLFPVAKTAYYFDGDFYEANDKAEGWNKYGKLYNVDSFLQPIEPIEAVDGVMELIEQIDDELARLEGEMHGDYGNRITKLRGLINDHRRTPPKQVEQEEKQYISVSEQPIDRKDEGFKRIEPNQSEAVDLDGALRYVANKHGYDSVLEGIRDRFRPESSKPIMELVYNCMQAAIEQDRKNRNKTN